jgi:hypothetical protein
VIINPAGTRTAEAERLLEKGKKITEATIQILEELGRPIPGIEKLEYIVAGKGIKRGFKVWKEETST